MTENNSGSIFQRAKNAQEAIDFEEKQAASKIDRAQQAQRLRERRLRYRCGLIPADRVCPCCGFVVEAASRWRVPADGTLPTCLKCRHRHVKRTWPKWVRWHAIQIVTAREDAGMTQNDLATELGMSRQRVVQLEDCAVIKVSGRVAWNVALTFARLKLNPPPFLWFITQVATDTVRHEADMVPWENLGPGQSDDTVL
jgi:DNA-binding XRE family transcriptional regulator